MAYGLLDDPDDVDGTNARALGILGYLPDDNAPLFLQAGMAPTPPSSFPLMLPAPPVPYPNSGDTWGAGNPWGANNWGGANPSAANNWGAAPNAAAGPWPAQYLAPVPAAPDWGQVPTAPTANQAAIFATPQPLSWNDAAQNSPGDYWHEFSSNPLFQRSAVFPTPPTGRTGPDLNTMTTAEIYTYRMQQGVRPTFGRGVSPPAPAAWPSPGQADGLLPPPVLPSQIPLPSLSSVSSVLRALAPNAMSLFAGEALPQRSLPDTPGKVAPPDYDPRQFGMLTDAINFALGFSPVRPVEPVKPHAAGYADPAAYRKFQEQVARQPLQATAPDLADYLLGDTRPAQQVPDEPGKIPSDSRPGALGAIVDAAGIAANFIPGGGAVTATATPLKAIMGGIGAANFPRKQFQKALNMEKAGHSAEDIWRATRFERGTTGRWLFEMLDKDYRLQPVGAFDGQGYRVAPLYDHHAHPAVQEAYPQFSDMTSRLKIDPKAKKAEGSFDPATRTVTVVARDLEEARKVGIHELMHVIQNEERLPVGASVDWLKKNFKNMSQGRAEWIYWRLVGEAQSRAMENRLLLNEAERLAMPPSLSERPPRNIQVPEP
jgi:hypothetical protein